MSYYTGYGAQNTAADLNAATPARETNVIAVLQRYPGQSQVGSSTTSAERDQFQPNRSFANQENHEGALAAQMLIKLNQEPAREAL